MKQEFASSPELLRNCVFCYVFHHFLRTEFPLLSQCLEKHVSNFKDAFRRVGFADGDSDYSFIIPEVHHPAFRNLPDLCNQSCIICLYLKSIKISLVCLKIAGTFQKCVEQNSKPVDLAGDKLKPLRPVINGIH